MIVVLVTVMKILAVRGLYIEKGGEGRGDEGRREYKSCGSVRNSTSSGCYCSDCDDKVGAINSVRLMEGREREDC